MSDTTSTLSIEQQLAYANLQIAAESFLVGSDGKVLAYTDLILALQKGNEHTSKFASEQEAADFLEDWTVVAQQADTSSGFSGTLFKNEKTGEYVISFRSTEFIDDAV